MPPQFGLEDDDERSAKSHWWCRSVPFVISCVWCAWLIVLLILVLSWDGKVADDHYWFDRHCQEDFHFICERSWFNEGRDEPCGDDATRHANSCYWSPEGEKLNMFDAQDFCSNLNGWLVDIHDTMENEVVTRVCHPDLRPCWIGLQRSGDSWRWRRPTGRGSRVSADATYQSWAKGQPNNEDGKEDCVAIGVEPFMGETIRAGLVWMLIFGMIALVVNVGVMIGACVCFYRGTKDDTSCLIAESCTDGCCLCLSVLGVFSSFWALLAGDAYSWGGFLLGLFEIGTLAFLICTTCNLRSSLLNKRKMKEAATPVVGQVVGAVGTAVVGGPAVVVGEVPPQFAESGEGDGKNDNNPKLQT